MASKSLELTVTLKGEQAARALKNISGDFKNAEIQANGLMLATGQTDKANNLLARTLTGVGSTIKKTTSDIFWLTKSVVQWWTVIGWIMTWKVIRDLRSFTDEFSLMNATLQARTEEVKSKVSWLLFEISNDTWKSVEEITRGFTQLLSAGLTPDGVEGSDEYMKSLEDMLEVQKMISQFALSTGSDSREMWDAFIYAANAFDLDPKNIEDTRYIMNLFAGTLDTGIGTMSEYGQQFVKFTKEAKQAGFTNEEVMALFARTTKTMTARFAGFTTSAFTRMMNDLPTTIRQARESLKRSLEEEDINKFLTGWDRSQLVNLRDKSGLSELFMDANGEARGLESTLGQVVLLYEKLETDQARNALVSALANNVNEKRILQDMLGTGREDIFWKGGIVDKLEQAQTNDLAQQKIDEIYKSFSVRRNQMTETLKNEFTSSAYALSPAMTVLVDSVTGMMSGSFMGAWAAARAFDQARKNVEDMHPAMAKIVDYMERFYNFTRSEEGKEMFDNVVLGLENTAKLMAKIFELIASIAGNPTVQSLMNFIANNPWESLVGGLLIKNIIWQMSAAWAAMWATFVGTVTTSSAWANMATVFWASLAKLTVWGSIAYLVGTWIGKYIEKSIDNKAKEVEDSLNKTRSVTDALINYRNGTAIGSDIDMLDNELNKKFTFSKNIFADKWLQSALGTAYADYKGGYASNLQKSQFINMLGNEEFSFSALSEKYGAEFAQEIMRTTIWRINENASKWTIWRKDLDLVKTADEMSSALQVGSLYNESYANRDYMSKEENMSYDKSYPVLQWIHENTKRYWDMSTVLASQLGVLNQMLQALENIDFGQLVPISQTNWLPASASGSIPMTSMEWPVKFN